MSYCSVCFLALGSRLSAAVAQLVSRKLHPSANRCCREEVQANLPGEALGSPVVPFLPFLVWDLLIKTQIVGKRVPFIIKGLLENLEYVPTMQSWRVWFGIDDILGCPRPQSRQPSNGPMVERDRGDLLHVGIICQTRSWPGQHHRTKMC